MKIFLLIAIVSTFSFFSCENYISNSELNLLLDNNDLNIELKIKHDKNHLSDISTQTDHDGKYILIDVENELSISSGEVLVTPNKTYKISVMMRNISSNPLVYFSFWESSIKQTRSIVLAGENSNPPTSETQTKNTDWKTYEETFCIEKNEKEFNMRIYSNSGMFYIRSISVEEI